LRAWLTVCAITAHAFVASRAWAIGTPAGTPIANTATVNWSVGPGTSFTTDVSVQFLVDELVQVTVTLQTVSPVAVNSPDTDRLLSFLVTNTGNGTESFTLALDAAQAGDQFDPANARLYVDSNGSTAYEPGIDQPYVSGTNDPALAADGAAWIFALCDIPPSRPNGDLGNVLLSATSNTATGVGTVVVAGGDGGTDALIGTGGGVGSGLGSYLVNDLAVSVVKSAVVSDLGGGSTPVPGSTITYSLLVTVVGTGSVANLVITDPLPPFTSYVAGSLLLDGTPLSDALDADAGDFGGTTANQVTVALGGAAGGSASRTISFAVTIN
jgi:uncharacterized repeat protein (TIGR01451 family)